MQLLITSCILYSKKKQIIYCYSEIDRFVLSVLYRVTSEIFKEKISKNCFSYKQGVNTADAICAIKRKAVEGSWGVKLDIHAYFNSVSRKHLSNCLDELFGVQDKEIRKTFNKLFMQDAVTYKGKPLEEYKSLIPGCALGSFFANYCLASIDDYFEKQNIVYARYSDDIILFADNEEKLKEYVQVILDKIAEYDLTINEDKYTYFKPGDKLEYLGLQFNNSSIDISRHAKQKMKKTFKRWCRKGRKLIEMKGADFEKIARGIIRRYNWRIYKAYIQDTSKFGWGYYAFRYLTTTASLTELDDYCKETLRALKTGKHTKGNKYALSETEITELGYVSFVEMYELFHTDFDYYCDVIARL